MTAYFIYTIATLWLSLASCSQPTADVKKSSIEQLGGTTRKQTSAAFDTTYSTVHLFVALCDNRYQGIVPVPEKIGNGKDPHNNLYWGCAYGVKTFFRNSGDWKLVSTRKPGTVILERLVFKHKTKNWFVIGDAYDGERIRECTEDFFSGSSGEHNDTIQVDGITTGASGNAKLLAYIGHDGLMDFGLDKTYVNTDGRKRDVIILACYSKNFFIHELDSANVNPLVWTTGLMCPEAYTVHDAVGAYIDKQSAEVIRTKAALAYSKYQKCSEKAARNLLVTGW